MFKQSLRCSLDSPNFYIRKSIESAVPHKKLYVTKCSYKKYHSTLEPLQQCVLEVKKQKLHEKNNKAPKIIPKSTKMKRKQKTQHHNYEYLEWLQQKEKAVDWVRYNMTLGLSWLWTQVQNSFKLFFLNRNISCKPQFSDKLCKLDQQIKQFTKQAMDQHKINMYNPKLAINKFSNFPFICDSQSKDSLVPIQKNIYQNFKSYNQKINHKKNDILSTAQATPSEKCSLNLTKDSITQFRSYFCLFKRDIALRKQNNLVSQFIERRSSGDMKLTPTDLQELQKIVKINEDRLLLMNEIVEHVGKLKNRNSQILLSDEIVKKISQIDLLRDLDGKQTRQQVLLSKIKTYKNIVYQILEIPDEGQKIKQYSRQGFQSQNSSNQYCFVGELPKRNKKMIYRSSIESSVSKHKQVLRNVEARKNHIVKSKNQLKNQLIKPIKTQKSIFMPRKSSIKVTQKKQFQEKEKGKGKKKTIKFFDDKRGDLQPKSKNIKQKLKSAHSIKSKKQLAWQDLQIQECRSLRSLKSFKSLKSNGSHSGIESYKYLRSLKTQRQMKYLKGRFRRIDYASKIRNRVFKFNGFSQERQQTQRDIFDLTTNNKISNNSLDFLISGNQSSVEVKKEHVKRQEKNHEKERNYEIDQNVFSKSKTKIKNTKISINNQNSIKQHQKQAVLRRLLQQITVIEKQSSIVRQKSMILLELQKLLHQKLIDKNTYERFKEQFGKKKVINMKQTIQRQEEDFISKGYKNCIYSNLIGFKQKIAGTTQLNQINKYYYNIGQFRGEEEQIRRTKQQTKKDECFFQIRSSIEKQNRKKRQIQEIHIAQRQQKLLQKNL